MITDRASWRDSASEASVAASVTDSVTWGGAMRRNVLSSSQPIPSVPAATHRAAPAAPFHRGASSELNAPQPYQRRDPLQVAHIRDHSTQQPVAPDNRVHEWAGQAATYATASALQRSPLELVASTAHSIRSDSALQQQHQQHHSIPSIAHSGNGSHLAAAVQRMDPNSSQSNLLPSSIRGDGQQHSWHLGGPTVVRPSNDRRRLSLARDATDIDAGDIPLSDSPSAGAQLDDLLRLSLDTFRTTAAALWPRFAYQPSAAHSMHHRDLAAEGIEASFAPGSGAAVRAPWRGSTPRGGSHFDRTGSDATSGNGVLDASEYRLAALRDVTSPVGSFRGFGRRNASSAFDDAAERPLPAVPRVEPPPPEVLSQRRMAKWEATVRAAAAEKPFTPKTLERSSSLAAARRTRTLQARQQQHASGSGASDAQSSTTGDTPPDLDATSTAPVQRAQTATSTTATVGDDWVGRLYTDSVAERAHLAAARESELRARVERIEAEAAAACVPWWAAGQQEADPSTHRTRLPEAERRAVVERLYRRRFVRPLDQTARRDAHAVDPSACVDVLPPHNPGPYDTAEDVARLNVVPVHGALVRIGPTESIFGRHGTTRVVESPNRTRQVILEPARRGSTIDEATTIHTTDRRDAAVNLNATARARQAQRVLEQQAQERRATPRRANATQQRLYKEAETRATRAAEAREREAAEVAARPTVVLPRDEMDGLLDRLHHQALDYHDAVMENLHAQLTPSFTPTISAVAAAQPTTGKGDVFERLSRVPPKKEAPPPPPPPPAHSPTPAAHRNTSPARRPSRDGHDVSFPPSPSPQPPRKNSPPGLPTSVVVAGAVSTPPRPAGAIKGNVLATTVSASPSRPTVPGGVPAAAETTVIVTTVVPGPLEVRATAVVTAAAATHAAAMAAELSSSAIKSPLGLARTQSGITGTSPSVPSPIPARAPTDAASPYTPAPPAAATVAASASGLEGAGAATIGAASPKLLGASGAAVMMGWSSGSAGAANTTSEYSRARAQMTITTTDPGVGVGGTDGASSRHLSAQQGGAAIALSGAFESSLTSLTGESSGAAAIHPVSAHSAVGQLASDPSGWSGVYGRAGSAPLEAGSEGRGGSAPSDGGVALAHCGTASSGMELPAGAAFARRPTAIPQRDLTSPVRARVGPLTSVPHDATVASTGRASPGKPPVGLTAPSPLARPPGAAAVAGTPVLYTDATPPREQHRLSPVKVTPGAASAGALVELVEVSQRRSGMLASVPPAARFAASLPTTPVAVRSAPTATTEMNESGHDTAEGTPTSVGEKIQMVADSLAALIVAKP